MEQIERKSRSRYTILGEILYANRRTEARSIRLSKEIHLESGMTTDTMTLD